MPTKQEVKRQVCDAIERRAGQTCAEPERAAPPHEPGQPLGSAVAGDESEARLGEAQPGGGAGVPEGAGHGQFASPAQGPS